jgi:hypothetical protein
LRDISARIDRYLSTGQEHDLEMFEDALAMYVWVARPVEALMIWKNVSDDPERFGPAGWPIVDQAIRQKEAVAKV